MRTKKGLVTSDKMNKTIVVSVHTYKSHPKYKKRYRITKKFYAHDENNQCLTKGNADSSKTSYARCRSLDEAM